MRIFSLNEDDAIVIGNGIVIRVLEIGVDEVELEVEHPDDDSTEWGELVAAEFSRSSAAAGFAEE